MRLLERIRLWRGGKEKHLTHRHGELGEREARRHLGKLGMKFSEISEGNIPKSCYRRDRDRSTGVIFILSNGRDTGDVNTALLNRQTVEAGD